MIQIKKRSQKLNTFQSKKIATLIDGLREKVKKREELSNKDIDDKVWKTEEVRTALITSQHCKCCFCENKRARKREFDGEHFRPKLGITGENHRGYWWLAYEWTNIFYACKTCNQQYKKNHFPIKGKRAYLESDPLDKEMPVLINPETEDPENFIGFDWQQSYGKFVKATGLDSENRGGETIRIIGLNDPQLLEERAETVKLLQDTSDLMKRYLLDNNVIKIGEQAKHILELTLASKRFAGFHRAFFRASGLGKYIAKD